LGAAGIGAAVCESASYGGLGAEVYLSEVLMIKPNSSLIWLSASMKKKKRELSEEGVRKNDFKTEKVGLANTPGSSSSSDIRWIPRLWDACYLCSFRPDCYRNFLRPN